jgi:hypothetical protein
MTRQPLSRSEGRVRSTQTLLRVGVEVVLLFRQPWNLSSPERRAGALLMGLPDLQRELAHVNCGVLQSLNLLYNRLMVQQNRFPVTQIPVKEDKSQHILKSVQLHGRFNVLLSDLVKVGCQWIMQVHSQTSVPKEPFQG